MNNYVSLSSRVLSTVARTEGIESVAVEPTLFDAVDGDALDRLFRATDGHVRFEYHGYEVTVTSDGDVSLDPLAG